MDKITDWAEVMSKRIISAVEAYLVETTGSPIARDYCATENALELVLSQSCAGPETIRRVRKYLALDS